MMARFASGPLGAQCGRILRALRCGRFWSRRTSASHHTRVSAALYYGVWYGGRGPL